ncbi:MAG: hypothetical protein K0Q95_190 [Bacteroidota bacterium]|jgi:hypothetical protein|nr:hypothetical protein [Bacteroidota bacterium]
MNTLKRIIVLFSLSVHISLFAQIGVNELLNQSSSWEKGYIFLKGRKDTLTGFVSIQTTKCGYLDKIRFCTDTMNNSGGFMTTCDKPDMDTLRFFGFGERKFKYFNFTDKTVPKTIKGKVFLVGWVEILETAAVNISVGFSVRQFLSPLLNISHASNSMVKTFTPMYCLKKGALPTILISSPPISDFNNNYPEYKVHEDYKQHLISYLSDRPAIAEKIKAKEPLLFKDVEMFVHEYNEMAKLKKGE